MSSRHRMTVLLLLAGIASCSTADTLVPPVDVGDLSGGTSSSGDEGGSAPRTSVAIGGSSTGYPTSEQGYTRSPQNTLEAQAQALSAGAAHSPVESAPLGQEGGELSSQPRMAAAEQPLNQQMPEAPASGQLESPDPDRGTQPQRAAAPQTSLAPQQASLGQNQGTTDTVRFLPIIGAPVQAVTPLSRQLGADARAAGLTIRSANDPLSQHILKGYFSAFADGGKVNVVYVWDVLDGTGARLHRLQGQESTPGNAQEPWASVPASLMQRIATKTVGDYMAWKRAQQG